MVRIERGYKRTYYKPVEEFYACYADLKEELEENQEELSEIAKSVFSTVRKTMADSKDLSEHLYNRVWEEIYSVTEKDEFNTEIFDEATDHIVRQKLGKKDRATYYQLFEDLIQNCMVPLTDRAIFARLDVEIDLPSEIQYQIVSLVKAYMALWDFIYKHPGAVGLLEDILEEDDPREIKAKEKLGRSIKNRAR